MSKMVPKKIHELLPDDSDLDTPDKPKFKKINKNKPVLLKKISEFNCCDSDEEEYNDNFNCAILNLNDSIVFSPSKDPDLLKTPAAASSHKTENKEDENNKNVLNNTSKPADNNDSGFITRIGNVHLAQLQQPDDAKSQYRPMRSRTQLFSDGNNDNSFQPPLKPITAAPAPAPNPLAVDTLKAFSSSSVRKPFADTRVSLSSYKKSIISEEVVVKETPMKGSNSHDQFNFVTPSARPPFSSSMMGTSTKTAEKDVSRNKVLYRTPMSSLSKKKFSPIRETPKTSNTSSSVDDNILVIKSIEYVVDKKIGSGGSSMVYLAKGRKSGTECAIKVVNLDGDDMMIDGYLNETKLLARLQGNVNVVKLFDYCHQPEKKILYMVMEKGESDLHKILQDYRSSIPLYSLMNYWYQMLQAVDYIHQNGVIHSDLKPANFLMIGGRLKLIDFGIASNISTDSTSIIKFSQAGTFNYISPEALIDTSTGDSPARGNQPKIRLSTRSDVWSLGCILYLLVYKKTPFSHIKLLAQKINAICNPRTKIDYPDLPIYYPQILMEMLKKCLVYNPKERATCAELLTYPFNMVIPIDQ